MCFCHTALEMKLEIKYKGSALANDFKDTVPTLFQNESRRSEMLAAACAVGVAGTFAAPIGGNYSLLVLSW